MKSCIGEGCDTLEKLIDLVVENLTSDVKKRDEFRLDETQSYDISFKMEMWDTAEGVGAEQVSTKMDLLFNED